MTERKAKILANLDLTRLVGAEIGALDNPLVAKGEGAVYFIDHCDTEALRAKYAKNATVDKTKLHVDAVWGDNSLIEALQGIPGWPHAKRLDYLVASHVIEHVPDVVGWLQEIHVALSDSGSLRLAIPDKRYTFDYLRRTTTLAEALEAYVMKRRRPSASRVLDFTLHATPVDCVQAWEGKVSVPDLVMDYSLERAMQMAREAAHEGQYHDVHCWVFTPESFASLCLQLAEMDLLQFECELFVDTPQYQLEFYIGMRPQRNKDIICASWQNLALQLQESQVRPDLARTVQAVPKPSGLTREAKLLAGLDINHHRGAEIGPLNRPLVPKINGGVAVPITYVDHCDTTALREKYADDDTVDKDLLHVDAVWGEKNLLATLSSANAWRQDSPLDYVVASHVIEHVPDLIGWLREVHSVLGEGGTLRLAVPDRRYTFDYLRRTTGFSEVVEAFVLQRRVPSGGRVLDFTLNMALVDLIGAWDSCVQESALTRRYTTQQALERAREAEVDARYYDVHCWVFTPGSFVALFLELARASLLEFECEFLFDTEQYQFEFIVGLKKSDSPERIQNSWLRAVSLLQLCADSNTTPGSELVSSASASVLQAEPAPIVELSLPTNVGNAPAAAERSLFARIYALLFRPRA